MKCQGLIFNEKKKKKNECHLLQILLGPLRVYHEIYIENDLYLWMYMYVHIKIHQNVKEEILY